MKKTLLSIVAIIAMVVVIASCNGSKKYADDKVKIIETYIEKISTATTPDDLEKIFADYGAAITEFNTANGKDVEVKPEDEARVVTAAEKFKTELQEKYLSLVAQPR